MQNLWRQLNLRGRLLVIVVGLVTTVVGVISSYFITAQTQEMREGMQAKSSMMRDELGRHGLALAKNVALASERALAMNDLLFLAQIIETTAANDSQFVYGALVNADGRVLIHTDRAQAGNVLTGPTVNHDLNADAAFVRDATYNNKSIMEVVAPLNAAGKRWGFVRFGLTLDALNREITKSEQEIRNKMHQGVFTSILVALVLVALGAGLGTGAANVLVRPLGRLMDGVQQIQNGRLDHTVVVDGTPEFVDLARAFNDMTLAVRRREGALEQALKEAGEANRLKSEFLANISHELRTPLNAILNVPAALLEDFETVLIWKCAQCGSAFDPDSEGPLDETAAPEMCPNCEVPMKLREETYFTGSAAEHRHFNQRALHSGRHLLQVVNDVLDFSKLQAAKMELSIDTWNVSTLVFDIGDTVQALADAKHVNFVVKMPEPPVDMRADRVRLGQVLINLLGNAIKFTPEKGTVSLAVEAHYQGDTTKVHFMVRDTGIGIPQDKLQIIFEAFRQAEGGHTRSHGGSGLGLAITAQLVQMHGGRVWAESKLGEGSVFHVVLPREQPVKEAPAETALKAQAPVGRRVLIIDDDEFYLELGSRVLRDAGFDVAVLASPADAFSRIAREKPDFIIVDIMMPHLNGVDVLRKLKSAPETRAIPVLISTGFHNHESLVRQLGALWLPKPWGAQELFQCLESERMITLKGQLALSDGPPPSTEMPPTPARKEV